MSGFLRQYVTVAVVAAVVAAVSAAVVAAGQVLRPQPRTRATPASSQHDHSSRAATAARTHQNHRAGLLLATTLCGAGVLLAPWAVAAGDLSGGELAAGLVVATAVAAGVVAATR